ncbi:hypothetical protein CBR_g18789 [Chara braunii]|uniref:Integrase catalytic domain-containing protein n=1 Tax=Chara braunii TaxID=69332 RepID=A0A388KWI9_CHABU|nr:hypothetical protein CBR_g18789 [Chara braunii]|eukprot:GBG74378.1 hypothetical protein CBR_g18789 [Chara braunii]
MAEANSNGGGNKITLDDLVEALDRQELVRGSVPKVETFLFKGERVSVWLGLVEQAMVGVADAVKFQRILKYVYHGLHEEVKKFIAASNDGWSRFKDGMQRKYRLGDGLLTTADLEAVNRNDYTTVGALAEDFKKKSRKVSGISEEEQCAIFLGLFKSSEAQELTSKGGGGEKLTWATIDKGVQEGDLDEVHPKHRRLAWREGGTRGRVDKGMATESKVDEEVAEEDKGEMVGAVVEDGMAKEARAKATKAVRKGAKDMEGPGLIGGMSFAGIVAQEALRRAAAGSAPPAMFRLWQEREGPTVRVEEIVGENEEVTQRLKAGTIKEEPIVVESDDEELGECIAMVDTGAEMNIIRERDAIMLGLEVDRSDHGILHGANYMAIFCGTTSNVIVEIDKVWARACFFVMPDVDHLILLGRSFQCRTKTLIFNKHDGAMILLMSDPACGNYEVITCRNTGSRSGRNWPYLGSFTYEESENERRRLWEAPEEEGGAGVLSLSLTDVNKAMEVVAAHDMADPEAIKALREQVLESPQEGEVKLIYRLPGTHSLAEEVRTIEEGPTQVEKHEQLMGGMYLLTNTLLQGDFDQRGSLNPAEGEDFVPENQDDEFEEGEIKKIFRAEEYDRIYLELELLLSCEMRDRDASAKAQKMRDGHLFIKRQVRNPKQIVCGRNRQIDIITALHDGIAGGHKGVSATYAKISELYYWSGMLDMVIKYCQSCVPCQERSAQRPGEPLHPRLRREVGAVVHLDLLFMLVGENGYNYTFDARDNLIGLMDGRAIRTKTDQVLESCIEEYYQRYPFVKEFVMDRGSEFTCKEEQTLLAGYGTMTNYITVAHSQAKTPVERRHSTITNLLAKWTEGRPGQWSKFLRATLFVENITVKSTTKYVPATLWYGRYVTFPIESFLKTWRCQDLETNLSSEELLDIRARQVGAAEERIQETSNQVEKGRMNDKMQWDQMARVRKEPLAIGDVVLLYDSSLEKQWSRKLDKRWLGPYRIVRCGEFGAYQSEELDGTEWKD